jgi:hypothetical protein
VTYLGASCTHPGPFHVRHSVTFKDTGALWFVEICELENLGGVQPRIRPSMHYRDALAHPNSTVSSLCNAGEIVGSVRTVTGKKHLEI